MEHESSLSSCCRVPTNTEKLRFITIDHQPILNHPFPHRVNALFYSLYSISLGSFAEWFKTQIQLRIICETVSFGKIMFHDLKQLGRIYYE